MGVSPKLGVTVWLVVSAVAFVGSLLLAGLSWSTGRAEPPPEPGGDEGGLSVYTGVVDSAALSAIVELGVDRHELRSRRSTVRPASSPSR